MQYTGVMLIVALWSLSIQAQDLSLCGTGYFIDLSVGYTPTGFGLELCSCSEENSHCELVHIIMRRENAQGEIELLDCPDISLTERWWREQKDLVDIYYADTCEEIEESQTHSDLYYLSTALLNPGDTLSLLVCKTDPEDNNIISMSATPGNECQEFQCAPKMDCPVEERIWKGLTCTYELPDFTEEVTLFDTCVSPPLNVSDHYVIMQTPEPGSIIHDPIFAEIKIMDTLGMLIASCDVSVLLAEDSPPVLPIPEQADDIIAGEDFPPFQQLVAFDTIGNGELLSIIADQSIDPYEEDACSGYAVTYRWTARDSCELFSEVIMTFQVLPNIEGPEFASLPADIDTIYAGESLPLLVDLVAVNPDGTTGGITVHSSIDEYVEDPCMGYDITYRWVAVDSCGNSSEITETFYVAPYSDPPVFLIAPDSIPNIIQGDTLPDVQDLMAVSVDGDTSGISVTLIVDTLGTDPCNEMEILYTWIASDSCGITSTVSQTFAALPDTSLSDFLLAGMDDMMIQVSLACVESAAIHLPIDPAQHPDKDISVTIFNEDWEIIDQFEYVDTISYDFGTGNSHIVYTISDQCGNAVMDTIQVLAEDVSAPIFICPTEQHIVVDNLSTCSATATWIPPEALDNCDVVTLTQTGGPLFGATLGVGTYQIEYTATDESMNSSICSFEFIVAPIDSTTLTCQPYSLYLDSLCDATLTKEAILGTDLLVCVPELQLEVVAGTDTLRGDTFELGQYYNQPIHYILCEPLLNICCSASIFLVDTVPPLILCQDTVTVNCLEGVEDYRPDLVTDCGPVTWQVRDLGSIAVCNEFDIQEIITREFIAIDASGNVSEPCIQTILIAYANVDQLLMDGHIIFPSDTILHCSEYSLDEVTDTIFGLPRIDTVLLTTDNGVCGIYVAFADELYLDADCKKIIRRHWTIAEPICGFSHRVVQGTQTIKIVDKEGPAIFIDRDTSTIFTSIHDCYGYLTDLNIDLKDSCQNQASLTYSLQYDDIVLVPEDGDSLQLPLGFHDIVIIAEDGCHNYSYDTVTIQVVDNVIPVAACLDNTIISITADSVRYSISSLDIGSYDNCEIQLMQVRKAQRTCSPRDTIFDDHVLFCCGDIGDDVEIILKTVDHAGNVNFCTGVVQVQEKLPPRITCPPDLIIDCAFPLIASSDTLDPYGHLFGSIAQPYVAASFINIDTTFLIEASGPLREGVSEDNCDTHLDFLIQTVESIDDCGQGTIRRTFIAVDDAGNRSQPCTQHITIVGESRLDTSHITWPEAQIDIEKCSITDELSPDFLGRPSVEDEVCSLYGVSYEDTFLNFSEEGSSTCSKIIREWTIINWCHPDPFQNLLRANQVIKITDFESPEFLECSSQVTSITGISDDCGELDVVLSKRALDDCTSSAQLRWEVQIDFYQDAVIDRIVEPMSDSVLTIIETKMPIGSHELIWIVTDLCGNSSECREQIVVENVKLPTILANGLSTTVHQNGIAEVWASDFNPKGNHPCGHEVSFTISRFEDDFESSSSSLSLTCNDLGPVSVKVYGSIETIGGQAIYDYATVVVNLQDNQDVCPSIGQGIGDSGNVKGIIFTSDGRVVPGVLLSLHEERYHTLMSTNHSDNSGYYDLGEIEKFEQYFIKPSYEDDSMNGVSTLDIITLQRHILGIEEVPSPYQIIAGDVNRDNKISVSDVLEIRRAILNMSSSLSSLESWRFIDESVEFEDEKFPLNTVFSDKAWITYDRSEVDFVGIKTGDVNNSVELGNIDVANNRTAQHLSISDQVFKKGETIEINFRMDKTIDLYGFQLALSVDPDAIEIMDVHSIHDELDVHFSSSGSDVLISANSTNGNLIHHSNDLFTLTAKTKGTGSLSNFLATKKQDKFSEIYNESLLPEKLNIQYVQRVPTLTVQQNAPNPFSDRTLIHVETEKASDILFEIFTSSGQRVRTKRIENFDGKAVITVDKIDLPGTGIYYYSITSQHQKVTKSFVVID